MKAVHNFYADKTDDIELENNLMEVYYSDMTNSENWKNYPGTMESIICAAIVCSGDNQIYNSNTYYNDTQIKAGQVPSPLSKDAILPGRPDHVPAAISESEREILYYGSNEYQ